MTVCLDELLAEYDQNTMWDDYVIIVHCPLCQTGTPFMPDKNCPICQGEGHIQYSLFDVEIVNPSQNIYSAKEVK